MTPSELTLFTADRLLPIEGEPLSPGAFVVRDGQILAVGAPEALRAAYPDAKRVDFGGLTLMPGLVNAHADASTANFHQFPHEPFETQDGRVEFARWLVALSRFKTGLSIADQQSAVRKALEHLRGSGTTTIADLCRYPAAIPLYEGSGLRVVALAEVENIQRRLAQEDFEQALALIDEVQNSKTPLVTAGLAPFSAYTLSKNLLRILANHAVQLGIPWQLHAALSFSEMEFFYDSLGEITELLFKEAGWQEKLPPPHRMTPIQYLHEIGVLKSRPALVGCLHLGPTDHAILKNAGCARIFCPQAFQYLKAGDIPWVKVLLDPEPFALGTWGGATHSSYNLWDEMRLALFEVDDAFRVAAADRLLHAATLGGAQILGLQGVTGSLVKNKRADFIAVDTTPGDESWAAGLIDQTRPENIKAVYVDGIQLANLSV